MRFAATLLASWQYADNTPCLGSGTIPGLQLQSTTNTARAITSAQLYYKCHGNGQVRGLGHHDEA
jgi:hypothetical protein